MQYKSILLSDFTDKAIFSDILKSRCTIGKADEAQFKVIKSVILNQ